jgi:hypothetical protein
MDIKKTPKSAEKFFCEVCDFKCSKQSDWTRHINRAKHLKKIQNTNETPKDAEKFICSNCANEYKYNSGLWKHAKTCKEENIVIEESETPNKEPSEKEFKILTNLVLEVVKSNADLQRQTHEMQKQMMEICMKSP